MNLLQTTKQKVVPLVAANKLTEALDVYIYEVLPITNRCLELYQKLIDEQVTLCNQTYKSQHLKGAYVHINYSGSHFCLSLPF